jgi:hypothetical protein
MSVVPISDINSVFLPLIKVESSSAERSKLLDTYKAALDATKQEMNFAMIQKIIDDSGLSSKNKSALIVALSRTPGGKVAMAAVHCGAGAFIGAGVGGGTGVVATLIPAVTVGAAVAGPVGAAIGGVIGAGIGLAVAASKL